MSAPPLKPLIPRHFSLWVDPPDERGDEQLHIVSASRTFSVKGHSFREFRDHVVPLLDGTRTIDEVAGVTGGVFRREDLVESLSVLAEHGIVIEGAGQADTAEDETIRARMAPQDSLAHELAPGRHPRAGLTDGTSVVVGLGGAGPQTALALAAAGVGTVRCVDWLPVAPADVYFAPFLGTDRIGSGRAGAVAELMRSAAPQVEVEPSDSEPTTDDDLHRMIAGSDVVVCCLDLSQSNLIYKLNRVCIEASIPLIPTSLAGAEVIVGPTVDPGRSACYMCYRMRSIACAANPGTAFAHERHLDDAHRDDSDRRENSVFGAGIAANLVGLEALKVITGVPDPSLVGRVLTVRLTDLVVERHSVLRKPWCPACWPSSEGDQR